MLNDQGTEGLAVIGFGSSKPYNKEAVMHCIELFKKAGVTNTYHSFIGRQGPTVNEMMDKVKADGIKKLTVLPFLMSTGEMSLKYIPEKLGIGSRYGEHTIEGPEEIEIDYLRPIGESPRVADILEDMIEHTPAGKGKKAIMLISHGSKVGYRSDLIMMNKERLNKKGYKDIYTAFMEFEGEGIAQCAERMVKEGVRHIIAVPLLLASGIHMNEDIPVKLGLKEGMYKGIARIWDRDIRIDITKPISGHPLMSEVISDIVVNNR